MGTYVYRVTAETVLCSDGVEANVAEYAYKPYGFFDDAINRKMHWKSGAQSSDNMAAAGRLTGRIAIHGRVYMNRDRVGSFYDDSLGSMALERLPNVRADAFPPKKLWKDVVDRKDRVTAELGCIQMPSYKQSITAELRRVSERGQEPHFEMRCGFVGGATPMIHTIRANVTNMPRLHAHWKGFVENARARCRELYNMIEE